MGSMADDENLINGEPIATKPDVDKGMWAVRIVEAVLFFGVGLAIGVRL